MSLVPFTKVESIGNDFVLLEDGVVPKERMPEFARHVSRRRFSVGSDGLLVIGRRGDELTLRMFNPDGSEDFCGNGLRCAAFYAFQRRWIEGQTVIHHLGEAVPATILADGSVRTVLEPASFHPERVPHLADHELFEAKLDVEGAAITGNAVTTGSTHFVVMLNEFPSDEEFEAVSSAVEVHPLFPERTSVVWAVPEPAERLRIRIWERGAGETLGCGTGSAAAAVVFARYRGVGGAIRVVNPGGAVLVELSEWDQPITITGQAKVVYDGEVEF